MKQHKLKRRKQYIYFIASLIRDSVMLLLLFVLLSGCKKEKGEYLLGDLKNQNPFTGTETIIYCDNNGDSIIFYGKGRFAYLFESSSQDNPSYYYINERDECSFVVNNDDFNISINLTTRYDRGANIDLTFTHIVHPDSGTCKSHSSCIYALPLFENYQNTNCYIDSLLVLNKYYYYVFVDSDLNYSGTYEYGCINKYRVSALYYTTTQGIIKLDFEDNTSWQLESIEW